MGIIICGLARGTDKEYMCPYCEFESDDIDDFATGMCWDCVYGGDDEGSQDSNIESTDQSGSDGSS